MPSFAGARALRLLVAVAAVALAVSWAIASRGVAPWEVDVGRWAYDLPTWTTTPLEVVMQAGSGAAPAVAAIVLAVALGWRVRAGGVLVAGLLTWLACSVAKAIVGRPRPTDETLGRAVREHLTNDGYPSSHTAVATVLAVAIVLLGRPRRWVTAVLVLVPVLTGLARLHLGVHWFLDVVGGAGLGALLATGVAYLAGLPPTGSVARAGADDELVVATYNLRNGRAWDRWDSWPLRARATADLARRLGADVVAVQEAFGFQGRFVGAALPGYEMVGRGRGVRGGEWCAIYVRRDRLRVVGSSTRWFGDEPDRPGAKVEGSRFPRIATTVRLADLATGTELDVVNTHLDERNRANRQRSIEQLLTWLDPAVPSVVVGDLNATLDEQPELFEALEAAGLRDALPDETGGTAHDYRGGTDDHRRIDFVFVSDHWEVRRAAIVTVDRTRRLPSDHWPVVAHLASRQGG